MSLIKSPKKNLGGLGSIMDEYTEVEKDKDGFLVPPLPALPPPSPPRELEEGETEDMDLEDEEEEKWDKCTVCNISFTDQSKYQTHIRGTMHSLKASQLESVTVETESPISTDRRASSVRGVAKSSPNRGPQSKSPQNSRPRGTSKKQEYPPQKPRKMSNSSEEGPIYCDICRIHCDNAMFYERHKRSRDHVEKAGGSGKSWRPQKRSSDKARERPRTPPRKQERDKQSWDKRKGRDNDRGSRERSNVSTDYGRRRPEKYESQYDYVDVSPVTSEKRFDGEREWCDYFLGNNSTQPSSGSYFPPPPPPPPEPKRADHSFHPSQIPASAPPPMTSLPPQLVQTLLESLAKSAVRSEGDLKMAEQIIATLQESINKYKAMNGIPIDPSPPPRIPEPAHRRPRSPRRRELLPLPTPAIPANNQAEPPISSEDRARFAAALEELGLPEKKNPTVDRLKSALDQLKHMKQKNEETLSNLSGEEGTRSETEFVQKDPMRNEYGNESRFGQPTNQGTESPRVLLPPTSRRPLLASEPPPFNSVPGPGYLEPENPPFRGGPFPDNFNGRSGLLPPAMMRSNPGGPEEGPWRSRSLQEPDETWRNSFPNESNARFSSVFPPANAQASYAPKKKRNKRYLE